MNNLLERIEIIFSIPAFDGDESQILIARILYVILIIMLGLLIIAIYLGISGKVPITNRVFFNVSAVIAPLLLTTLLILLLKGYVSFVAWGFVLFQWLSTVIQVIGSNGIKSPALGAFITTVLLAGFMINRRGVIVFGTLSVLSILGVWSLENNNMIPPPIVFNALPAKLFILLSIMTISTALLYMVMRTLQDTLKKSENYALELEKVVHDKVQAEKEILSLNQQLHKQVGELERFTYTASHDLRSPLVTIKGFLGMLEKDMHDNRPEKISSDIKRIAAATDKMDELLSDLLELSRIGRLVKPPEEIDTVRLIRDALESVNARIRASKVTVHVAPDLPPLYGDRIRLREVFENLLDNAAKYMGDQPNPTIEIGAQNKGDETIFFVKDNGMGIETQYQERIFSLFEKLNPTIEGTGIGLALVKRIIETHGGMVWVESEGLGKGSTFCFTLPEQPV